MPSEPTFGGLIATAPVDANSSGRITVGDRVLKTRVRHGKYTDLEALIQAKGSLTTDGYSVVDVQLDRDGAAGVLTETLLPVYVTGLPSGLSGGQTLPRDKWSCKPSQSDVPVERHVAWGALSDYRKKYWRTAFGLETSQSITSELAAQWLTEDADPTLQSLRQIKETSGTMPITIWTYRWTSVTYFVPPLTEGNFVQVPGGPGAAYLPGGMTWRRSPDDVEDPGEGIVVTLREWIGLPSAILSWNTFLFGS